MDQLTQHLAALGLPSGAGARGFAPPALGQAPVILGPREPKLEFRLYFPVPPHRGATYRAAKTKDGLNFVGLLLGHGGRTLQKIQRATRAKIEICNSEGNLNGSHPLVSDTTLHARIQAETLERLQQACLLVAQVLQPTNTQFQHFIVAPGGEAVLTPIVHAGMSEEGGSTRSARRSARKARKAQASAFRQMLSGELQAPALIADPAFDLQHAGGVLADQGAASAGLYGHPFLAQAAHGRQQGFYAPQGVPMYEPQMGGAFAAPGVTGAALHAMGHHAASVAGAHPPQHAAAWPGMEAPVPAPYMHEGVAGVGGSPLRDVHGSLAHGAEHALMSRAGAPRSPGESLTGHVGRDSTLPGDALRGPRSGAGAVYNERMLLSDPTANYMHVSGSLTGTDALDSHGHAGRFTDAGAAVWPPANKEDVEVPTAVSGPPTSRQL
ncbi:unnamed protein product [Pedinophyceae sp. YPF-701]|nr:unnamed protein product [Pedinophyceae sp. YPF-701]